MCASLFCACFAEFVCSRLVYRKEIYAKVVANCSRAAKQVAKRKQEEAVAPVLGTGAQKKAKGKAKDGPPAADAKDKKLIKLEKEYEIASRDMMVLTSRVGMIGAIVNIACFFWIKGRYESEVLTRLPFTPYHFITKISHRNIPGDDMRECGVIFIYALCSASFRPVLQRLLGHIPPKSATPDTALMVNKFADRLGIKLDD